MCETAEVFISISKKTLSLRSSFFNTDIRLEIDEIAKFEVCPRRQEPSNFAIFGSDIDEQEIFKRLKILHSDLSAADNILDESLKTVSLEVIDDRTSICMPTREMRSSIDGLSCEAFSECHPHSIDRLVYSSGQNVTDAHGVGDQSSLFGFIFRLRFERSLVVGSDDGGDLVSLLSRSVDIFQYQRLDSYSRQIMTFRINVIHNKYERESQDDGDNDREETDAEKDVE